MRHKWWCCCASHCQLLVTVASGWFLGSPPNLLAGTSNWSGDYFMRTAGSALVVNQTVSQTSAGAAANTSTIRDQLQAVFERDWSSQYSADISDAERWETICGSH